MGEMYVLDVMGLAWLGYPSEQESLDGKVIGWGAGAGLGRATLNWVLCRSDPPQESWSLRLRPHEVLVSS